MQCGVHAARHALGLHPCLEAPDFQDGRLGDAAVRIAELVRQHGKAGPQFAVARHRLGTQQGLALPGNRPPLVVGPVGGQGAHQRPLPSFRAQAGVDEQGRLRARPGQQRAQLLGRGMRRRGRLLLVRSWQRVMHEHHVRVTAVSGLVAAEPAHRHHAQPGGELTPAARHGPHRHLERGLDDDRRYSGKRLPGLLGARPAEQIGHGGPEQFPAAQCAQCREALGP